MGVIYVLILVSLFVALVFLAVFFLAVRNGQFEDNHTPAVRILFKDEKENNQTQINK